MAVRARRPGQGYRRALREARAACAPAVDPGRRARDRSGSGSVLVDRKQLRRAIGDDLRMRGRRVIRRVRVGARAGHRRGVGQIGGDVVRGDDDGDVSVAVQRERAEVAGNRRGARARSLVRRGRDEVDARRQRIGHLDAGSRLGAVVVDMDCVGEVVVHHHRIGRIGLGDREVADRGHETEHERRRLALGDARRIARRRVEAGLDRGAAAVRLAERVDLRPAVLERLGRRRLAVGGAVVDVERARLGGRERAEARSRTGPRGRRGWSSWIRAPGPEVGELAGAGVAGSADSLRVDVGGARERIRRREAVVGAEQQLGRRSLVRHPLVERGRLDVPVHHPAVAQVGERVRPGVRDRHRVDVEVRAQRRRVVVLDDSHRVAGDAGVRDQYIRDRLIRGRRGERVDREVLVADRLVGGARQAAGRVSDPPALTKTARSGRLEVHRGKT